jgi:sugar phosphate isomerase/epimerase
MSQLPSLLISFSTLGLPEANWAAACAVARAYGLGGVELRALGGSVDLPRALKQEFSTPPVFADACTESGLKIVSLDSSLRLIDAQEDHRQELRTLAEWAHAASVPFLRVFDGGQIGEGRDAAVRSAMLRELDVWQQLKEREGFSSEVMVETHWALTEPKDARLLAEESGGRLHLLWDVCHTWLHSGVSLAETWEELKPWVSHIHVKDGVRDPNAPGGFRHTLPGEGELEIPALLETLAGDGFKGAVSLEWEKFWHPDLPSLEDALSAGRRHGWW